MNEVTATPEKSITADTKEFSPPSIKQIQNAINNQSTASLDKDFWQKYRYYWQEDIADRYPESSVGAGHRNSLNSLSSLLEYFASVPPYKQALKKYCQQQISENDIDSLIRNIKGWLRNSGTTVSVFPKLNKTTRKNGLTRENLASVRPGKLNILFEASADYRKTLRNITHDLTHLIMEIGFDIQTGQANGESFHWPTKHSENNQRSFLPQHRTMLVANDALLLTIDETLNSG